MPRFDLTEQLLNATNKTEEEVMYRMNFALALREYDEAHPHTDFLNQFLDFLQYAYDVRTHGVKHRQMDSMLPAVTSTTESVPANLCD